jgi:anti-sigma factor RsiW
VRTRTPQPAEGVTGEQLVALADGTLSDPERTEVEARVAASAEATELLRAQRRALAAIHSFDPPLPEGFASAPAPESRAAPEPGAASTRRAGRIAIPRPRAALRPALAALGALAVVVLAIVVAPGERGGPVASMAALSALRAPEPAPQPGAREGTLRRTFAGVTFPDWDRAHGWRAVGARRDQVDGRATDTVYYVHTHHRIGYTVRSGTPVAIPSRGRRVRRDGVDVQLYRDGARTVAVFERAGRTCVLAGVVHREETLVKLATWRGEGALRF